MSGERNRENARERSRHVSADVREIGPLPKVAHPKLRKKAEADPVYFLKRYFPQRFYLGFGKPHLSAIDTIEKCIRKGGLHAFAMQRGGGKTTLTEPMLLRALLYGFRRYVVFIGATDPLATAGVKRMQRELETNDLLLADFPEVCYPIRRLERITQRARGQTLDGKPTNMEFTDGHFVLPSVSRSKASGGVVQAFGVTGAIKGLQRLLPDGGIIRPDLVLLDDCQTRESAKSPTQTADRERVICDDVLGLAGPTTKIAAVFLCTPIYLDDLTERFIDRERHPEWKGVRTQMVERFPDDADWWDNYAEVRRESLRSGDEGQRANDLYAAEREKADAGCVLSWPERVKDGDLSGIQTAMNLRIDNPEGFANEYQCKPVAPASAVGAKQLQPAAVAARLSGVPQADVPADCTRTTAFIDCGGEILWYAVCAWNERFGGSVIDYGTWPRQTRSVFTASSASTKLSTLHPNFTEAQRLYAGLAALIPAVIGRAYRRAGGQELRVERALIDAGWKADPVYDAIAASPLAGVIFPSKGVGRSLTSVGVARWKTRPGERSGYHWRLTLGEKKRGKQLQFDPDAWKTFAFDALTVGGGGGTALTLFGTTPHAHAMIADHFAAEKSEVAVIRGETFDKWRLPTHEPDNHLWDCVVGCAVAASVAGVVIPSGSAPANQPPPRPRKKGSEIQAEKQAKAKEREKQTAGDDKPARRGW